MGSESLGDAIIFQFDCDNSVLNAVTVGCVVTCAAVGGRGGGPLACAATCAHVVNADLPLLKFAA